MLPLNLSTKAVCRHSLLSLPECDLGKLMWEI